MKLVPFINQLLGVLTLIGGVIALVLFISLFFKENSTVKKVHAYLTKNSLLLSFIVALIATLGSLFYSEIAGYEPCKLCWYQRICMYPLVLLLGIAYRENDRSIVRYALSLSGLGFAIAFYHYMLQLGIAPELPCAAVGVSISCSKQFVLQWGYISIPVMALTAFSLILIFLFIGAKRNSKKTL